ncbi:MAG: hypothetical protein KVP17_000978 [Porospora cf. gigantea B]|uniref:uncharacterized protein n=1 Tax=Porospora cf. gigantea B TaxID=2853592 RepID=UPI003571A2F1|nr:MAG: hypothetical protein KVP17_000978 [Porospora cf. gigantea B]
MRRTLTLKESHEEFLPQTSKSLEGGVSSEMRAAVERGQTIVEKKASWPFDFYQASDYYPVDYHYWWSPYRTVVGKTQLVMMHATCSVEDGSLIAADQMLIRPAMRQAARLALKRRSLYRDATFD